MKRLLCLSIAGTFLLALPGASLVWSKAHVPLDRVQVCTTAGVVKTIKLKRLAKELAKGSCRLPTCIFGPGPAAGPPTQVIFFSGNACTPGDASGHPFPIPPALVRPNGICDIPFDPAPLPLGPPNATGLTAACTNPF